MRKTDEQSLKDLLQEMVEFYRLRGKLNQTRIRSDWSRLMGPAIARYTTDLKIRRKKLYVSISSAALRQELSYGKDKIKNLLNEELGEDFIEEVIIR